eukprot:14900224-Alexandrium_andersonii.AAC.1
MRDGLAPLAALSPAQAASAGETSHLPSLRCGQPRKPAGPSRCPLDPLAPAAHARLPPRGTAGPFPRSPRGNLPA